MEQPAFAQEACATVVELAHHRELREPNKAEFDQALDAVIRISEDAKPIDDAKRYKKGRRKAAPMNYTGQNPTCLRSPFAGDVVNSR